MFWIFKKQPKFGTGALEDPIDLRDLRYEEVASAGEPVDWNKGYDIERELNFKLPYKNQDGSSSCFPAGTKVLMEDLSYKSIEKIHIGEKVVTHNSKIEKVLKVMKRKWQGTMFTIKGYGLFSVTASPEHPFLLDSGEWIESKNLCEGMYLTVPKTGKIVKDKLDYDFEYDDDFLWAIGFYLAEGCLSKYSINFSIHEEEMEYHNKIKNVFGKLGANVSYTDKKDSKGMVIVVNGKIWSEKFLDYGGKLCFDKELNRKFLTLKPEKQLKILQGWMDGDGCYKKDCYVGVTTSKKLVRQMNDIAKRNGIKTAIRKWKKDENKLQVYELQFGRDASQKLKKNTDIKYKSQYGYEDENNFYVKIDKIDKILEYHGGHIYNIEVENDNSYIVETVAVHNCVGQGWSYYVGILNLVETGVYSEVSAKAIYSQVALGSGRGAYIRDGAKLAVNWGSLYEHECLSYMDVGNAKHISPNEDFMIDKTWKTPELDKSAKVLQAKEYRTFQASSNMDLFAMAIRDNYGVVGGVNGDKKGKWGTNEPIPPNAREWGHCIYFGKFGIDEKGKFISTPNSWGNAQRKVDALHPDGWQKLREDYFNFPHMFNPWTLLDKPNIVNDDEEKIMSNAKLLKDKGSKAVGFWLPAVSEDGLRSMALNYGYKLPLKENGTVDWNKIKFDGFAELTK